MKSYNKHRKKIIGYFRQHAEYNSIIHVLGGVGIGILIASPFANPHPLRWGLAFLGLSLVGHLYAWQSEK